MKEVTFNVVIEGISDIDVDVEVSDKDYKTLKRYADAYNDFESDEECVEFEECKELAELYKRIIDAAYDEMANGAYEDEYLIDEFCDGEYDFDKMRAAIVDHYEICASWPDLEEDEEDESCR